MKVGSARAPPSPDRVMRKLRATGPHNGWQMIEWHAPVRERAASASSPADRSARRATSEARKTDYVFHEAALEVTSEAQAANPLYADPRPLGT